MSYPNTANGTHPDGASNYPSNPKPPKPPNSTGRQLLLKDARKLLNAEAFTAAKGNPFLSHTTLHLGLSETFTPETWPEFQTGLLDKASRWMQQRGLIPAFAWVRECGEVKHEHLHLLTVVPQSMWSAFKLYLLRAGNFIPYGMGGEAIRISGGVYGTKSPKMRAGLCRYVLKSLAPATCNALGISHRPTEPVPIKRCGTSANIGLKARQAAGWQELHSIADLFAHLHPGAANDNQAGEVGDAA